MIPRLLCPLPASGGRLQLSKAQAHHLLKVLRLRQGDALQCFDGHGLRFEARLEIEGGSQAWVQAGAGQQVWTPPSPRLWLAQGLAGGDKMDWVVEKAVEIGVARLTPLACDRSIVRLDAARAERRHGHWQAQVEAACMQSQRDALMQLDPLQASNAWLLSMKDHPGPRLILDPQADQGVREALHGLTRQALAAGASAPLLQGLVLLVGPESGFSDQERDEARRCGFVPAHLGRQVLRTETAALVACSKLQAWIESDPALSLPGMPAQIRAD